jgi:protein phosphatase
MCRLTPELARVVPHKNILTQSVGFHGPVDPDTATRPIKAGDIFLLCSDGLTDALDDPDLARICKETPVDELSEVLVNQSLEGGTEDNVTVIVVNVVG